MPLDMDVLTHGAQNEAITEGIASLIRRRRLRPRVLLLLCRLSAAATASASASAPASSSSSADYSFAPLDESSSDDDAEPSPTFSLFLAFAEQFVSCPHPKMPAVTDIAVLTGKRFKDLDNEESYERFRQRERRGVGVLDFQCFVTTAHHFLRFYLKAANADDRVEDLAKYLAMLSLLDHKQFGYGGCTDMA
uniref:Cyclin C-terminal domain-containing protein n=1 Tax=Oryza brachyantha TaxID=4533 RepID=J3M9W6_ORYBR